MIQQLIRFQIKIFHIKVPFEMKFFHLPNFKKYEKFRTFFTSDFSHFHSSLIFSPLASTALIFETENYILLNYGVNRSFLTILVLNVRIKTYNDRPNWSERKNYFNAINWRVS